MSPETRQVIGWGRDAIVGAAKLAWRFSCWLVDKAEKIDERLA